MQPLKALMSNLDLREANKDSERNLSCIHLLPTDYIEFMKKFDGGEGFLKGDIYLNLWTLKDVCALNPYFPDEEFSKQVIVIGSNGGGLLYGFDLVDYVFFEVDEFQMSRGEQTVCGKTFTQLIKKIYG